MKAKRQLATEKVVGMTFFYIKNTPNYPFEEWLFEKMDGRIRKLVSNNYCEIARKEIGVIKI